LAGHTTVQLAILLMLVFSADSWLNIPNGRDLEAGSTQHLTIVFNVFVFMQVWFRFCVAAFVVD
jgi:hypothetical protein